MPPLTFEPCLTGKLWCFCFCFLIKRRVEPTVSIAGDRSKQEGKRRRKKRKVARHLNRLLLGRRNAKETCQLRYLSRHCVVTTTWLRVTKWNCTGMIIFYRGVTCPKHCVTTWKPGRWERKHRRIFSTWSVYISFLYLTKSRLSNMWSNC